MSVRVVLEENKDCGVEITLRRTVDRAVDLTVDRAVDRAVNRVDGIYERYRNNKCIYIPTGS